MATIGGMVWWLVQKILSGDFIDMCEFLPETWQVEEPKEVLSCIPSSLVLGRHSRCGKDYCCCSSPQGHSRCGKDYCCCSPPQGYSCCGKDYCCCLPPQGHSRCEKDYCCCSPPQGHSCCGRILLLFMPTSTVPNLARC